MKNNFNKTLIAGALMALASAHCFADVAAGQIPPPPPPMAQVQPASVDSVATPTLAKPAPAVVSGGAALEALKSEELAPVTLYSKTTPAQKLELKASEESSSKMDELNRKRDQANAELELIKIEQEKVRAEAEIRKMKGEKTPSEITAAAEQEVRLVAPAVVKAKSPLENIFVTQIYGMSGEEQVTAYFNNSIVKVKRGDLVTDGVRLVRVLDNGAIFSYKGKTRTVLLTTEKQAESRSFSTVEKEQGLKNPIQNNGYNPMIMNQSAAYPQ